MGIFFCKTTKKTLKILADNSKNLLTQALETVI